MLCDTLQKEIYKAVDKRSDSNNFPESLKQIETVISQSKLQSNKRQDELLEEFVLKFISEHPDKVEELTKQTAKLAEQIVKMIEIFGEFIGTAVQTLNGSYIFDTEQSLIENYPDKRLVQLALYGRTERIRKRNRHRILKEIEKKLY